jgi:hypothetical protein
VAENPATTVATRFVVVRVDAPLARDLAAVQKEFPQQKLQACTPGR